MSLTKGWIDILSLADNIVTLDFETTGFSAERDEIIQWVRLSIAMALRSLGLTDISNHAK